jgi:hypothetical protein
MLLDLVYDKILLRLVNALAIFLFGTDPVASTNLSYLFFHYRLKQAFESGSTEVTYPSTRLILFFPN